MKILALDDEKLMLMNLVRCIQEAEPEAEVYSFTKGSEVLNFIKTNPIDIAFLDIKIRGDKSGVDIGKMIQEQYPNVNIVFCTGYSEYSLAAVKMHCSGYVEKPVTVEAIKAEISNLRFPINDAPPKRIRFQCFGNFEVFIDNKPVDFKNKKAKELLAYLVDRNGTMCTKAEISAAIWEDDGQHDSYYKKIKGNLLDTLNALGCNDLIIIQRASLGVNKEIVDCDYYDWKDGKNDDLYQGEYMMQYSWAEYTIAI